MVFVFLKKDVVPTAANQREDSGFGSSDPIATRDMRNNVFLPQFDPPMFQQRHQN